MRQVRRGKREKIEVRGQRPETKPREDGRSLRSEDGRWKSQKSEIGCRMSEIGEIRCAFSWRKFHRLKVGIRRFQLQ